MTQKLFGTDGIRGTANVHPMTAEVSLRVAMACAQLFRGGQGTAGTARVVIGKDTRLSGYMFEEAMAAGFVSMGMEVVLVGPIPTPGIALLTRSLRADLGVMISASHNPYQDNGIKLFGHDGYKLPDELEHQIEQLVADPALLSAPKADDMGRALRLDDALGRYIEAVKASFPRGQTLQGLKIVLDCAHGAAYRVAPQVLWELEADVITMNAAPNGTNINDQCGATHPKMLQERVVAEGADIGIALDGDADRLIVVDERGQVVDGDQLIATLALHFDTQEKLAKRTVVTTVMSNLGLERALHQHGIALVRAAVGDRYVVEAMRKGGFNLGGEQSGHIVMTDFGTTGDGLLAALQILGIVAQRAKPASQVLHAFSPVPQLLQNVRYPKGLRPLEAQPVQQAIKLAELKLGQNGRLLVRPSGTEPLIRVMAEGDDATLIKTVVNDLCGDIEKFANTPGM
jgi:phosphoglucosamine mutase